MKTSAKGKGSGQWEMGAVRSASGMRGRGEFKARGESARRQSAAVCVKASTCTQHSGEIEWCSLHAWMRLTEAHDQRGASGW